MDAEKYKALLTDIIAKQAVILGPAIALIKARSVPALTVDDTGRVTAFDGSGEVAVKALVDAYVDLSGQIVKSALTPVFAEHGGAVRE